jgi:hypothetical protein
MTESRSPDDRDNIEEGLKSPLVPVNVRVPSRARAKLSTKQRAFLAAFETCGIVARAATASNVNSRTHRRWVEKDADYAEAFAEASETAADWLEAEAHRRAAEGLVRYRFNSKTGEPLRHPETNEAYYELEYSDRLLEMLLRARRPEKFRDRVSQELTGKNGGPIETVELLSDEERCERIAALFRIAQARRNAGQLPPGDEE